MRVELLVVLLGTASLIVGGEASMSLSTSQELAVKGKQNWFFGDPILFELLGLLIPFSKLIKQMDFSLGQIIENYGDNQEPAQQLADKMRAILNNNAQLASYPQQTLDIFTQLYAALNANGVEQAADLIQRTFAPFNQILKNATQVDAYGDLLFSTIPTVIQEYVQALDAEGGFSDLEELNESSLPLAFQIWTTGYEIFTQISTSDLFSELKPVTVQAAPHIERAWDAVIELFTPLFALVRSLWSQESELASQLWTAFQTNAGPDSLPYFPLVKVQFQEMLELFARVEYFKNVPLVYVIVRKTFLKLKPLLPQLLYLPEIWSDVDYLLGQFVDQIEWNEGWINQNGDQLVEECFEFMQLLITDGPL